MTARHRLPSRHLRHALLLLALVLTACRESPSNTTASSASGGAGETPPTPASPENQQSEESQESPGLKAARQTLEKVTLRDIVFESTSAEEASAVVQVRAARQLPDEPIRIVVRRAIPVGISPDDPDLRSIRVCASGHDFSAPEITAWQLLQRIASDNRMEILWIDDRLELRPKAEPGTEIPLLPLNEE